MIEANSLSLTSDLISAVFKESGKLLNINKEILNFWTLSPLQSTKCEDAFQGPLSEGFFERIKESLSKLPSNHSAQIVFERSICSFDDESLFNQRGLISKIYLFEKELIAGSAGMKQLFEELGIELNAGSRSEYLTLCNRMLGQSATKSDFVLPDVVCEEDHLKASKSYVKVASLTDLPLCTWNNCFEALYESGDEFLTSIKIRVPDKSKTKKDLETKRRVSHALSARKAHELSDLESGSNLSASEEILVRVTQGKESLLNISLTVLMSDSDLSNLESRMGSFAADVSSSTGSGLFVEGVGTLPVVKSHMVGAKPLVVRELPMLSGNLAHLLPVFLDYGREQDASSISFLSRCGELCHLNLFSKTNLNFNAFVCGASGSGKSFLMNSSLAGFKHDYPDGQIAIFDVGGSYRKLVSHFEGSSIDLDSKKATELVVAALKRLKIAPTGFCKTLLENICGAGEHITHSHKVAIEDLLQACSGAPFSLRVLSNEAAERKEKAYEDISLWLRPYLNWDDIQANSTIDAILDEPVRAFDFKNLEGDPLLQRLAILILTQGIWERLKKGTNAPTLIVFDEVWKFFSQASGFLEEMYRTFRKYRAGIASVTQNLSDYGDNAFAKLVITNSFHRILLQGAASGEILARTLDMSESDRKRFLSVASKKNEFSEFWLGTPKFSQILRLYPSKKLYELANSENISSPQTKQKGDLCL